MEKLKETAKNADKSNEAAAEAHFMELNAAVAKQQGEALGKAAEDEAKMYEIARRMGRIFGMWNIWKQRFMK